MKTKIVTILLLVMTVTVSAKKKPEVFTPYSYGANNQGTSLTLKFEKGKEHNHPLFAVWLADENGKFIQTLYVSKTVAKGFYEHGNKKSGRWLAGEIQRPATLPYWAHQRGIVNEYGTYLPTAKQPEVDAYTGATPPASFIFNLRTEKLLKGKYKIMLELNQSWDWNEFWYNDRFPDDKEYKTSSQPALVYSVDIDTNNPGSEYIMKPIGHSHYSGANGNLTADLSTLTTALKIAKQISVKINQ